MDVHRLLKILIIKSSYPGIAGKGKELWKFNENV
jgi:hypothetical protein